MIFEASGLLFDNDGVLVDSMGTVDGSWGVWSKTYSPGFQISYEHHGRRASEIVASLIGEELFEEALAEINRLELELTHLTTAMPGAKKLLESLESGTWTVVTSAGRDLGTSRLKAAGLPVPDELVCADDVSSGKPNPEPYLMGAKKLSIDISQCIVFEDAPSGVAAGVAAGASAVIGIGEEVLDSKADVVISSLEGISFLGGKLELPDSKRLR
ncbi:MAG: HAD family hydrolase [Actinobacteria bacterium]|jgi:sugar-phosphatase|nr:HAD family hydrolase [Actinomycetota bacterium]NCV81044.1 HAD family hydrolase [Actinomycetota bacterium]NCV98134.1 HAD family hydrolase [Actinomycetota bacterium]NCW41705.1 HAD family hydrolase [Actinomycetota bacterium]